MDEPIPKPHPPRRPAEPPASAAQLLAVVQTRLLQAANRQPDDGLRDLVRVSVRLVQAVAGPHLVDGPSEEQCSGCHGHSLRRTCPVRHQVLLIVRQFLRTRSTDPQEEA